MALRVIDGGLSRVGESVAGWGEDRGPTVDDVRREAARRLSRSGYDRLRSKELATGAPMPATLKYLRMQIDFAAEALSQLAPIPADFRSDDYWPA